MSSHFTLSIGRVGYLALLAVSGCLLAAAGPARAQVLVAADDLFELKAGETLVIEAFGILDNDTLDDESAGESGAEAELVVDASQGTLALSSDGSFTYSPGVDFDGTDSFVYRAVFGGASDEATVRLTACSGGPQIFTCWKEGAFLEKAAEFGHPGFREGFEDDGVWGLSRSPDTVLRVSARGFEWRANDFDPTHSEPPLPPAPPPNQITTGSGAAMTGDWGIFDREHGYATGSSLQCDVDAPDEHCLYHDGWTIRREDASGPLYGAGGFITGMFGANVAIVLDGDWQNPIGSRKLVGGGHHFLGVIDAGPDGFTEIQFRETDGKIGQALFIWGDVFTLLAAPAVPLPTLDTLGVAALILLVATVGGWRLRRSQ